MQIEERSAERRIIAPRRRSTCPDGIARSPLENLLLHQTLQPRYPATCECAAMRGAWRLRPPRWLRPYGQRRPTPELALRGAAPDRRGVPRFPLDVSARR